MNLYNYLLFINSIKKSIWFQSTLPTILVGTPSFGLSVRHGLHYLQLIRNGEFRQFDYDSKQTNLAFYGKDTPPEYDLTRVTTPINIFHSKDDDTAILDNVIRLQKQLPNVKSMYLVPIKDFGHVDFIYSRFVRFGLYNELISKINNANRNN